MTGGDHSERSAPSREYCCTDNRRILDDQAALAWSTHAFGWDEERIGTPFGLHDVVSRYKDFVHR